MKQLLNFDKWLFLKINRDGRAALLDLWMPFVRNAFFWAPLYLFLAVFMLINFGKKAYWWIVYIAITAGITDLVSSHFIKPTVARIRPCNDPGLFGQVHLLAAYCGSNGSFTSSHAANHFGMATFIFFTLHQVIGRYTWIFFAWAALISYAQVYVGVHFPLDVFGGALLGCFTGAFTAVLFKKFFGSMTIKQPF